MQFVSEILQTKIVAEINKKKSYTERLLQPVSSFLFCTTGLLFILGHPSVVFVPLLPLIITAFFLDSKSASTGVLKLWVMTVFWVEVAAFVAALTLYQLYYLNDKEWGSETTSEVE